MDIDLLFTEFLVDCILIGMSSSSAITALLFLFLFLFDKWIWKTGLFFKILKYPDISGEWSCKGISDYQEEF
ncbi:hypothetical protein IDM32_16130 [Acinetobacter seifertii]|nr:hypothetical protein [Acinetobacter seifertii]